MVHNDYYVVNPFEWMQGLLSHCNDGNTYASKFHEVVFARKEVDKAIDSIHLQSS